MSPRLSLPRMYTDAAGDSRFDRHEMDLTLHDHAPPGTATRPRSCLMSPSRNS